MAKYEVIITETLEHKVFLEADSLKEAKEKGYEIIMNGSETDYDTESLGTQLISANSVLVN
jgi:predicted mannosyl-3-phosphoglycerate phosphatase (HAD superfamily)